MLSSISRDKQPLNLVVVQLEQLWERINDGLYQTDRHPELPSMRARCRAPIRARLWREWAERPNRGEGPFVLAGKHKVSQGYSPADENAGLAYALRDDTCVNGLNKRRNSNCTTTRNFVGVSCKEGTPSKDTNAAQERA
jgi:hypothetical protein